MSTRAAVTELQRSRYADKFGIPIVTFVDTPGAFAGRTAEELGQGEAIAFNLREMFGLQVPVFSVVIGEGGSGGALAIGCANRNLILENAVYYVASPEACAAILWKSRDETAAATEALRVTSTDLHGFGIMDRIIPEPLGGAHRDPMATFPRIKQAIMETFKCAPVLPPDPTLVATCASARHWHFAACPFHGNSASVSTATNMGPIARAGRCWQGWHGEAECNEYGVVSYRHADRAPLQTGMVGCAGSTRR